MSEVPEVSTKRRVGLWDVPRALLWPRRVFARVEDVPSHAWPIIVLLTLVTLIGYATVQTGLIDRHVEEQVRARIAEIDSQKRNVVERSELRDLYAEQVKQGEFDRLVARIQAIGTAPLAVLAWALLVAAALYGTVALTGRKPEWHTLLTIAVFAGFVDALRRLAELALMLRHGTAEVGTSLAVGIPLWADANMPAQALAALRGAASGLDPFYIWYWVLVGVGVSVTAQLPGWRGGVVGVLGWLIGTGLRTAIAVSLASLPTAMPASP